MSQFDAAFETISSLILRGLVAIYHAVEVCTHGRNPTYETMAWSLYNHAGYMSSSDSFNELDIGRGDALFIAHDVRRTIGFQQVHKIAIHWINGEWRAPYTMQELFIAPPPPWLYIGYGEDTDHLTDCTEELNCIIAYDNRVTPAVLTTLLPSSEGKTWYYINTKTFETAEFPAEGILIDESSEDEPPSTKDD